MKKFAIAMMSVALLAGCGADKPKDTATENAQAVPNANAGTKTYKVATTGNQPPFSYRDERGNLIGMDIDIIKAIGEEQGFAVEFDTSPWHDVLPSVASGKNDLAISGVSYNEERNAQFNLSKRYLYVPSAIMVTDPAIKSIHDLSGRRFSCMIGAKQCGDIAKAVPTAVVSEDKTTFLTFASLAQGKTDAIGEDKQLLEYFLKKHPDVKARVIAYESEKDPQSSQVIVAGKGKDELITMINEGIDKLTASGKIAQIERQWLDNPY